MHHPVLVDKQPPSHGALACHYFGKPLCRTLAAFVPLDIRAVVVVAQNRHHPVVCFQPAQGFLCGIQLVGRNGDNVPSKGYQVSIKAVDLLHHPLQGACTVAERARVNVAQLHDAVAVECLGQIVEGHLDSIDTHAVSLNQNAVAHQQHRHRQRKQSPCKASLERQTKNPRQQPGHCHIEHSQCHPAHTQNNNYRKNLSVHNLIYSIINAKTINPAINEYVASFW